MIKRGDFYEEDEPIEDLVRAFETGIPVFTWPPVEWGFTWFSSRPVITHSANVTLHSWKTPWGSSDD